MDGIYEEPGLAVEDRADLASLDNPWFDVVRAVQTGRDLIDQDECGAVGGYVAPPWTLREAAGVAFWLVLGAVVLGGLLTLAVGWAS